MPTLNGSLGNPQLTVAHVFNCTGLCKLILELCDRLPRHLMDALLNEGPNRLKFLALG